jgi:hypothetical protein
LKFFMVRVALTVALLCGCGAEGEEPSTQPQIGADSSTSDSFAPRDTRTDQGTDTTTSSGDSTAVTDSSGPITPPPPIEDTSFIEDFGAPPAPGSHVEASIGPDGGELAGNPGTPLENVKLVIPKGALTSTLLFAIDIGGPVASPPGGSLLSPYVRIAPDGVAFAIPARLTLPWKTPVMSPQIAPLARIGSAWSSLQDPVGTATTITASMRRTSPAAAALLDVLTTPSIKSVTKSGTTLFIDGSGFGLAQIYKPSPEFVSSVKVSGVVVPTLGWSDTSIAVQSAEGTVTVTNPAGSATKP